MRPFQDTDGGGADGSGKVGNCRTTLVLSLQLMSPAKWRRSVTMATRELGKWAH